MMKTCHSTVLILLAATIFIGCTTFGFSGEISSMNSICTKAGFGMIDRSIAVHDTRLNPFVMPLSGKKLGDRATIRKPLLHYFKQPEQIIKDPTRPTYHLVSRSKKMHIADPNFGFFWKGRYHLFYISGTSGFAHASSTDMVHWSYHPNTNFGGLSGTMFLNTDGIPTIICKPDSLIALLTPLDDNLEKWEVLTTIEPTFKPGQDGSRMGEMYWDPDAWTEGDTTYVLFGEFPLEPDNEAALLKSADMKTWHFVDYFLPEDMAGVTNSLDYKTNDDLSCPNFFKIGNKWMLLCISHNKGCRYYLGDWKDGTFTPDFHGWMNWSKENVEGKYGHGGDVFAPESLLTPDGRRVMWAWLFAQSQIRMSENWHEVMSLPRELSLPEDGVLRIKPLRELEQLRYDPVSEKNLTLEDGTSYRLKNISGDAIEMMVTIKQGEARRYGVRLLCDKDNGKGLDLVVEPARKTLRLGAITAPLELKSDEDIQLRIFIDRSVVEVFANERQAMAKQHAYTAGDVGVCLFSEGAKMEVSEVKGWQMKPAYTDSGAVSERLRSNFPISTINYRPAMPRRLADAQPFYWNGDYHVFYFGIPADSSKWGWQHLVSKDLVHWKELPTAVKPSDEPADPDFEGCWSGSIIEHKGVFYLFYTGKNSQDPKGDQKVMCATSTDLIKWVKKPEMTFYADGKIYWSKPVNGAIDDQVDYHHQAFRDPDLLWNEAAKEWTFVVHAASADKPGGVIGHYTSKDLKNWVPKKPLFHKPGPFSLDCPQMFFMNKKWYIISAGLEYISADSIYGPYSDEPVRYGYGTLEAPKTMYDGKRRILIGWLWGRKGFRDEGDQDWGGTMSMAREIYAGKDHKLYMRPVGEVVDYFDKSILELKDKPKPKVTEGAWIYDGRSLLAGKGDDKNAHGSFEVPADYLLHARIKMPSKGTVTVGLREQPDNAETGYKLILSPESGEIILSDLGKYVHKMPAELDYSKPIDILVFVTNNIIECFVNDAYNLGIRAYNFEEGLLSFECAGGEMEVQDLEVKVPSEGKQ